MAPKVTPVRSDESLPEAVDVVIIGGGIIGVTTAFFLLALACPLRSVKKAPLAESNRAETGAGPASWAAMSASCRWE